MLGGEIEFQYTSRSEVYQSQLRAGMNQDPVFKDFVSQHLDPDHKLFNPSVKNCRNKINYHQLDQTLDRTITRNVLWDTGFLVGGMTSLRILIGIMPKTFLQAGSPWLVRSWFILTLLCGTGTGIGYSFLRSDLSIRSRLKEVQDRTSGEYGRHSIY